MKIFWQDLRYALRMAGHNPAFTAIIVLTLGLGIGANTAVFSFVHAVFIKPLPYPEPDKLVQLWGIQRESGAEDGVSAANFLDWKQQSQSFSGLAAYRFDELSLRRPNVNERLMAIRVSSDFLPILGTQPFLGRSFASDEFKPGALPVVVLSYGAWQQHWGGQSNLLGSPIILDGQPHMVVGILPPQFSIRFPFCGQGHAALAEPEAWLPLALDSSAPRRGGITLLTLARLRSEVTLAAAQAEMKTVASRLERQYPDANQRWEILVLPLHELKNSAAIAGPMFLAPVALVLLIACVNVANMLLARAISRRKEIAIRLALGAGRIRLARQHLTESLLLATLGGGMGVLLAYWGCDFIRAMSQESLFVLPKVALDGGVLLYTAAITLFSGVLVGLLPTFQASRLGISECLQHGADHLVKYWWGRRFSHVLVVAEVTCALVLLSATGLLLRSLIWTWNVDLGFRSDRVVCLDISLPATSYPDAHKQRTFFELLHQRVRSHSGIQSCALVSGLPTANRGNVLLRIPGRAPSNGADELRAGFTTVSPNYFEVMTIPLLMGRNLAENDIPGAPDVALVNEAMAKKYWPQANPVGALVEVAGRPVTLVGVVGNVRRPSVGRVLEARPEVFTPCRQWPSDHMSLVVKSRLPGLIALASVVKSDVTSLDPSLAVAEVQTLASAVSKGMAAGNLIMTLMGIFALAALALAAMGIYGLIAYAISRRTHEFGIRMAVGAQRKDIFRLVLGQGARLLIWGVGLGVPLSFALGKILAGRLYRVTAFDPLVLLGVTTLLILTGLAACCLPARRAAQCAPLVALKHE